ncbi:MAG TPA: thioesterase family protein [Methylomirabilota bacterium]|nr:thioesterase family protein [Methylomirabilota bacterium]
MPIEAPFAGYIDVVRPEWIDRHGHLGIGACAYVFEEAARAFFRHLDISQAYRERSNHAFFAVEGHFTFRRDLRAGDRVAFTSQILDWSPKRLLCLHAMADAGSDETAAINEVLYAHVDLAQRRSVPLPATMLSRLRPIFERHAQLPRPAGAGAAIALAR